MFHKWSIKPSKLSIRAAALSKARTQKLLYIVHLSFRDVKVMPEKINFIDVVSVYGFKISDIAHDS